MLASFAVLKSRVSKVLGLDETAASPDDVLLGYELNDAVREFLLDTHINVNRSETEISSEEDDSEIGTPVLVLLDIQITGTNGYYSLPERTTPAEILRMRRASPVVTGTARYYALNGNDLMMFYPSLQVGDVVMIYYVPKPTEMSSGSHDPALETYGGIPVEYHPALIEYAKWKMADYDDDGSSQMGAVYQMNYERLVRKALKRKRLKGGRALGRAVVGRQPVRLSSPSQDIW
jgi:hypothetical protein